MGISVYLHARLPLVNIYVRIDSVSLIHSYDIVVCYLLPTYLLRALLLYVRYTSDHSHRYLRVCSNSHSPAFESWRSVRIRVRLLPSS